MNNIELQVKHSGTVDRTRVAEGGRGTLLAIEEKQLPFVIRRVYTISGVSDAGALRGEHAHKKTDQALFVVQGALTLHLDDGTTAQAIRLTSEDSGIRLGPLLWHSMSDLTTDCVALIAASLPYDGSDYIREYDAFKTYVGTIQ
jgi:hypothetical protein